MARRSVLVEQVREEPRKDGHPDSGSVRLFVFRIQFFRPLQTMGRISGSPMFGWFHTVGDPLFACKV
jgi:hypothetical protein